MNESERRTAGREMASRSSGQRVLDLPETESSILTDENDGGGSAMDEPISRRTAAPETTLRHDLVALARHWLRGRRGWLLLGAVAAGGLWLGWPSLVAAGLAPLLLGLLPCVAMCALGLCLRGGRESCGSKQVAAGGADTSAQTARPALSEERQETER
jgi:hypothetical protein